MTDCDTFKSCKLNHFIPPMQSQYSQNALGARPPNRATVVTDRRPIPQAFTNSFNNQRYSDQSLNCAVTRSKVHKALDQFF